MKVERLKKELLIMATKGGKCPKCGKELTNNDSCMFCHIVPETYQKKWAKKDTKANVLYFDKMLQPIKTDDRNNNLYESSNGGNVENFMGVWDYYILNEKDKIHIDAFPKYIENYLGKEVENLWSGVYELFIEGNTHKKKPTIKKINIATPIYDFWKEKYRVSRENVSALRYADFKGLEFLFDEIDKFLLIQHIRRFENIKRYFVEACELTKQPYNCFSNEYMRTCYLKLLVDCVNNEPTNILSTYLSIKKNKFSPVAIFASQKARFILSDNPVVFNVSSIIDKNLGGGLYMAISPEVLIAYLDLSAWRETQLEMKKEDLILVAGTDDFICYYNKLLLDKSFSTVAFSSEDIKKHIADDYSQNQSFNKMLGIPCK